MVFNGLRLCVPECLSAYCSTAMKAGRRAAFAYFRLDAIQDLEPHRFCELFRVLQVLLYLGEQLGLAHVFETVGPTILSLK